MPALLTCRVMDICTIIAKNYVAQARVLARSFAEHHPGGRISVLVIDDAEGYLDKQKEPFRLLTPASIGCEPFEAMSAQYDVIELSTAVKPWLLRSLLREGASAITYLDPDIRVYGSLVHLDDMARAHGIAVTPHNTQPIPDDGQRPTQVDIMIAGVYNLGCVSFAAGAETDAVLDWWSDRLRRDCRIDPVYGYFVDQRWFDLVPGLVSDYAVIREPQYNIAYWNVHSRKLEHDGRRYTVDGEPLRFFHFSGFDPSQPQLLSRHQTRVRLSEYPALARICREYADEAIAEGFNEARRWPYGFDRLPDGSRFTGVLRRLFAAAESDGALTRSPYTDLGFTDFLAWLAQVPEGAPAPLNRVLFEIYERRPDVRAEFPDALGDDLPRFLEWASTSADPELELPES